MNWKIAQKLGALAVLSEDIGSKQLNGSSQLSVTQVLGYPMYTSGLQEYLAGTWYKYIQADKLSTFIKYNWKYYKQANFLYLPSSLLKY